MVMRNILSPKNDYVFKLLFTRDTEILADLINRVLALPENERIRSVEVRNPVVLAEDINKKFIILDIHAVDESGRQYDIEMQVRKRGAYPERALYYLCKIYAAQLSSGQDYGSLNPVVGIHFLDYELFPDYDDFRFSFQLRDIRYPNLKLTDDFTLHVFELPGIEKAGKQKMYPGLEWLKFFNRIHEEEGENMKEHYKNPLIHRAYDVLKTLSADEEIRHRAKMREQALVNEAIFVAGERKKGKEEGKRETAVALLKMGIATIDQIAEATKLSVGEIEKLSRDLQNIK